MCKILIVEDDKEYQNLLISVLKEYGYHAIGVESPIKAIEAIAKSQFDLVISDLHLPIMSGIDFIESAKNISPSTAFVVLTGRPDEGTEITSIINNIDLYIDKSKPLSVILEYLKKILSTYESGVQKHPVISSRAEGLTIDVLAHKVYKNNEEIKLTPKEFEILKLLLKNKNIVLSREDIIEQGWQKIPEYSDLRLVDSHVKNLRKKIMTSSLMTVRSIGYRWNEVE